MAGDILVLFDGVCRLCVGGLGFIMPRDPGLRVRFAAMQSPAGQMLLRRHGLPLDDFKSFAVLAEGRVLQRSDAVIRIASRLKQPWPLIGGLLRLLPRPLRDALYDVVARNRYRWFGVRPTCFLPTPEIAARFLEREQDAIQHI
jgi:predicted DCC family thiol-disulfide oxidoreductase YuxK